MTPSERQTILNNLETSRDRILSTVQGLSPRQTAFQPPPDRWSIDENIEHVIVVERRVLAGIQRTLGDPNVAPTTSAYEGLDDQVVRMISVVVPEKTLQAPEPVRPTGRWQGPALLNEFELARKTTRDFVTASEGDLKSRCFPHPFFGLLSCYQWLLAISAHCDRHRTQIEQVKAAPAFPPS